VPITPGVDSLDGSVAQHVPPESLQTYEERQSTQEAAIHFLMEAIHQQKQEMTMMRNQMTMMSQLILTSGIANPSSNLLMNTPSLQTFGQLLPAQPSTQRPALPFSQSQGISQVQVSQPVQQTKEEAFRRHQAWGHPAAAARNGQRHADHHSPSTDSSEYIKASPRNSLTATPPVLSPNPLESINSEFNTVTLDDPNFNFFASSSDQFPQPQTSDDQMVWM
jgi:uncharacterized coiled-coil protein SlyX